MSITVISVAPAMVGYGLQDEGESLQQQHQREQEQLRADAAKAWQEVEQIQRDAAQAALKAAQDMETLTHNHSIHQVRTHALGLKWYRLAQDRLPLLEPPSPRGANPL